MFENPRTCRQARNLTTKISKNLDLKSSSEQIFSENCRWVPLHVVCLEWFLLVSQKTVNRFFHWREKIVTNLDAGACVCFFQPQKERPLVRGILDNFEISLAVLLPNTTTSHAITRRNRIDLSTVTIMVRNLRHSSIQNGESCTKFSTRMCHDITSHLLFFSEAIQNITIFNISSGPIPNQRPQPFYWLWIN